jgi:beta-glucosidase/6-phospho-beta-glucosidase/beta-galactosidase
LSSFWIAGFESACHINTRHERVDMIAGVQHDRQAAKDYHRLREAGMSAARDGLRWPLIDHGAHFDFRSFLPMLRAAVKTKTQVVWNLSHYGYPDGLDLFSPRFVERFATYARMVAKLIREHTDEIPFYTPVNEISFFSWAAARDIIYPFAHGRDDDLKCQMVRAAIAACETILDIDPRARFLYPEPVIHVFPPRDRPDLAPQAEAYTESQYEAWDMIAGRAHPELGGSMRYLDIPGVNYYHSNQWELGGDRLRWEDDPIDSRWIPFHRLLARVWERYQKPLLIAETSHFGAGRARWIREIGSEVYQALQAGVPVGGVCIYPILDRYDWENRDHWHNSGLWDLERLDSGKLKRVLNSEYAIALTEAQQLLAPFAV